MVLTDTCIEVEWNLPWMLPTESVHVSRQRVVVTKKHLSDASVSTVLLHCDNCGVILHGYDPYYSLLKGSQKQADLVCLLKSYSWHCYWFYDFGHSMCMYCSM
jgi:hypothetical protein